MDFSEHGNPQLYSKIINLAITKAGGRRGARQLKIDRQVLKEGIF